MCDCPKDRTHDYAEKPSMTTTTIFQKCANLPIQRSDYTAEHADIAKSYAGRKPTIPTLSDVKDSRTDVPSLKLSSSGSSNGSERKYEFVNSWDLECGCPIGGEGEGCSEGRSSTSKDLGDELDESLDVECTLAIIKPEAVANRHSIENRIIEEGFEIEQARWLQMTSEQVSEFYANSYGSEEFAHLVAYMSSGPVVVQVLAKKDAIQEWRFLMGPAKVTDARMYFPDCIRALYGRKGEDYKNAVHGSANREDAQREINFFFPEFIVEPLLRGQTAEIYLWEAINKVLAKGVALCCQLKPRDPILWLANWLIINNPNTPKHCGGASFIEHITE